MTHKSRNSSAEAADDGRRAPGERRPSPVDGQENESSSTEREDGSSVVDLHELLLDVAVNGFERKAEGDDGESERADWEVDPAEARKVSAASSMGSKRQDKPEAPPPIYLFRQYAAQHGTDTVGDGDLREGGSAPSSRSPSEC